MRRGKKQFHFEHQIIVQIIESRRASSSGLVEDSTGIRFPISAPSLLSIALKSHKEKIILRSRRQTNRLINHRVPSVHIAPSAESLIKSGN